MPLRDHRSGSLPRRGSHPAGKWWAPIGAGALLLILSTGFVVAWMKSNSLRVDTDPTTLCATNVPPTALVVILLDVSDQFSEPQRLQIQNHLIRVRDSVPRLGLIELYTLDRVGRRLTEPVIRMCNPGTGEDLSELYQNPTLARKQWNMFAATLGGEINRQISAAGLESSPIFEALQSTALWTFGKPEFDGVRKRLVVVSDLLQHVQGGISMYQEVPSFAVFKTSPEFSRIRSDLSGVSVDVFYLARPTVRTQGLTHIAFWEDFFQAEGATLESVEKVYGDQ